MIELIFYFGSEIILVRVTHNDITFSNSAFGNLYAPIENLKLSKAGVIKEFPELELEEDWKEQAIERFKRKVSSLETLDKKAEYIIEDLKKHGYIPRYKQRQGFRREVIK